MVSSIPSHIFLRSCWNGLLQAEEVIEFCSMAFGYVAFYNLHIIEVLVRLLMKNIPKMLYLCGCDYAIDVET